MNYFTSFGEDGSMMSNKMVSTYADSAVASRCGEGMKPCDGRCIPGGAKCHSTEVAAKKGGGFHTAAKIAAGAGVAGAAAVGFRNRKAIGEAAKSAVEGTKKDLKQNSRLSERVKASDAVTKRQVDLGKKAADAGDYDKARMHESRGAAAANRREQAKKDKKNKSVNPLRSVGRAGRKLAAQVVDQGARDLRLK